MDVPDSTVAQAIARELRQQRMHADLSRPKLAERAGVRASALEAWESGIRTCPMAQFVKVCQALGTSPGDVLTLALQRAKLAAERVGMVVDLRKIIVNKAEPQAFYVWATRRIRYAKDGMGVIRLEWVAIEELAITFGMMANELAEELRAYTPDRAPR